MNERLTKEKYVELCNEKSKQYVEDVLNDDIVVNKYIKQAVNRSIIDKKNPKFYLNQDLVNRVFEFFSFFNINFKNEDIQFNLLPYQCFIITELFSYHYKKNNKRRYNQLLFWVARKNGKSIFSVIIMLFFFIYYKEKSAEIYLLANNSKQASHLLDYAKDLILDSPQLNNRIKILQHKLRHKLKGTCYLQNLASDSSTLDGLNPFAAVIDEIHEMPTNNLLNIMKNGMKARFNPLIIITSSAGFNISYPFYKMVELGKKVLINEVEDERTLYIYFTLDNEDEIENPEMWIKSNPNMNYSLDIDDYIIDYKRALLTPSELRSFIIKNLNVYQIEDELSYIPIHKINEVIINENDFNIEDYKGCKAYLGYDLSKNRDITALSILIIDNEGNKFIITEMFIPDISDILVRKDSSIDISDFINDGYIHLFTGEETTDYEFIKKRIDFYNTILNIEVIGYDAYNSRKFNSNLESDGYNIQSVKQTTFHMNMPTKELERDIFEKDVKILNNPALIWNFYNVVLGEDLNGNIKPEKKKSKDNSIDGVISILNAYYVYLDNEYDSFALGYNQLGENKPN